MQFDFNDYVLVQAAQGLNSRSEVNLSYIPIITAPMDTVVNDKNADKFRKHGITICFPRNVKIEPNEKDFISVSLDSFKQLINDEKNLNNKKICIDVANGNMPLLHDLIIKCKNKFPQSIIMAGNVASEQAFVTLSLSGCDYIRVGVGSGSGCLTSVHTGVGQGMATLIDRCYNEKIKRDLNTYIVADGGFKSYRDIIMAIALGADYVMLGGLLNKCLESCAVKNISVNKNHYDWITSDMPNDFVWDGLESKIVTLEEYLEYFKKWRGVKSDEEINDHFKNLIKNKQIYTTFRGMSTKAVQKEWGREKLQSSEGIEKINKIEYTIDGWMENFIDYLKSAMSYSGASSIKQFQQESDTEVISINVFNRFNK